MSMAMWGDVERCRCDVGGDVGGKAGRCRAMWGGVGGGGDVAGDVGGDVWRCATMSVAMSCDVHASLAMSRDVS